MLLLRQAGPVQVLRWKSTRTPGQTIAQKEREAERAAAKPCPTGRLQITGTVLSVKAQPSDYAPGGEVLKMLVKTEEGWLAYGSVPSCLFGIERGDRVRFKGTITPSERDNKFGFFKRPTNAVRI